jgi:hypothetical protein
MQKRFVITGLELVGADQEAVGILLYLVGDLRAREAIEGRFRDLPSAIYVLTRERDDGLIGAFAVLKIGFKRVKILDGTFNRS